MRFHRGENSAAAPDESALAVTFSTMARHHEYMLLLRLIMLVAEHVGHGVALLAVKPDVGRVRLDRRLRQLLEHFLYVRIAAVSGLQCFHAHFHPGRQVVTLK